MACSLVARMERSDIRDQPVNMRHRRRSGAAALRCRLAPSATSTAIRRLLRSSNGLAFPGCRFAPSGLRTIDAASGAVAASWLSITSPPFDNVRRRSPQSVLIYTGIRRSHKAGGDAAGIPLVGPQESPERRGCRDEVGPGLRRDCEVHEALPKRRCDDAPAQARPSSLVSGSLPGSYRLGIRFNTTVWGNIRWIRSRKRCSRRSRGAWCRS